MVAVRHWVGAVQALLFVSLFSLMSTSHAAYISLDADGTTFGADFRTGTNNVGVIFFHGRGQNPNGDVVRHLQNSLNAQGYSTMSLENPVPVGGTSFYNYDTQEGSIDNQVFSRLSAALVEMSNNGVDQVVLSGFSLGSRFMTASAAAWDSGLFTPTVDIDLLGLVGVGMYGSYTFSAPTAATPLTLDDINVLDTHSNLSLISSLPVLDIYGSHDYMAVANAGIRRAAYGGDPTMYVQAEIECPANDGTYYARAGGVFQSYYGPGTSNHDVRRCHQLRNGWLPDGSGGFTEEAILRNSPTAPLEVTVTNFFADYIEPRITRPVPESSAVWSMLLGLSILMLIGNRQRLS